MAYEINSHVRAALFDIDGTLTTGGEVWGALIQSPDVLLSKKCWLYATGMPHYLLSKTGIVSQAGFRDRWVRLMAWLMKGWRHEQAQGIYRQIDDFLGATLRPNVVEILKQHKTAGHPVILVSTMFDGIVGGLADYLGADAGLGSEVEFRDGRCMGRVVGLTCSGARKVEFAERYLKRNFPELPFNVCAAYADSQSDIPLLAAAGYPVAVYPDEGMRTAAIERGWAIYEDET